MRVHKRSSRVVLAIIAGFVVAGCAHAPRMGNETESVLTIREDYLRAYPDGAYNEYIRRGEVTKGMNFIEVLASWGVPDRRLHSEEKNIPVEYWSYLSMDEASLDWVRYTFAFEKKHLVEWDLTRHNNKYGTLSQWSLSDVTPAIDPMPGRDRTSASLKR